MDRNDMSHDYQENVRRGAALLDERNPGWRDRINKDELTHCNCILYQLYDNDYYDGKDQLGLHGTDDAIHYGFYIDECIDGTTWRELWLAELGGLQP